MRGAAFGCVLAACLSYTYDCSSYSTNTWPFYNVHDWPSDNDSTYNVYDCSSYSINTWPSYNVHDWPADNELNGFSYNVYDFSNNGGIPGIHTSKECLACTSECYDVYLNEFDGSFCIKLACGEVYAGDDDRGEVAAKQVKECLYLYVCSWYLVLLYIWDVLTDLV